MRLMVSVVKKKKNESKYISVLLLQFLIIFINVEKNIIYTSQDYLYFTNTLK